MFFDTTGKDLFTVCQQFQIIKAPQIDPRKIRSIFDNFRRPIEKHIPCLAFQKKEAGVISRTLDYHCCPRSINTNCLTSEMNTYQPIEYVVFPMGYSISSHLLTMGTLIEQNNEYHWPLLIIRRHLIV